MNRAVPVAIIVIIGFLAFFSLENSKQKELIYRIQQRLEEVDYERKFKDNLKEELEARKKEQEFLLQRDYEKQFEEKIGSRLNEMSELQRQDVLQLKESLAASFNEADMRLGEYAASLDELKEKLEYYSEESVRNNEKLENSVNVKLSEFGQLLSRHSEEIDVLRREIEEQGISLNEVLKNYNDLLNQVTALKSAQPEPAKEQQK